MFSCNFNGFDRHLILFFSFFQKPDKWYLYRLRAEVIICFNYGMHFALIMEFIGKGNEVNKTSSSIHVEKSSLNFYIYWVFFFVKLFVHVHSTNRIQNKNFANSCFLHLTRFFCCSGLEGLCNGKASSTFVFITLIFVLIFISIYIAEKHQC